MLFCGNAVSRFCVYGFVDLWFCVFYCFYCFYCFYDFAVFIVFVVLWVCAFVVRALCFFQPISALLQVSYDVVVTNTGAVHGKETVMVYWSPPDEVDPLLVRGGICGGASWWCVVVRGCTCDGT